jgi:hypothetical protein
MLKQREATVNISASVPLSIFTQIQGVETEAKLTRSMVIRELIKMGLDTYTQQKAAEAGDKGD